MARITIRTVKAVSGIVCQKPCVRKIEMLQEEGMELHRTVLNGRHMLFQICHHLRTSSSLQAYYNAEQLMDVTWQGDSPEQIGKFLNNWMRVTLGTRTQRKELELAELLFNRMKEGRDMATACEMYRRVSHSTPRDGEHAYKFLVDSLQHFLDDNLEEKNLETSRAEHQRMVNTDGSRTNE